ncbi:MAG: cytidine deaminase, partial [Oscillospiraceae bacterium]|nr:cytidine deaminase [Oscillospiraceae bacterium]
MELKELLRHVDHTLLRQDAAWDEIRALCDDALTYQTASVCVPPSYVRPCADYLAGRVKVCTVIGFPNGYSTTLVKSFEAAGAVQNWADEIDMVMNLGWVKDEKSDDLRAEMDAV